MSDHNTKSSSPPPPPPESLGVAESSVEGENGSDDESKVSLDQTNVTQETTSVDTTEKVLPTEEDPKSLLEKEYGIQYITVKNMTRMTRKFNYRIPILKKGEIVGYGDEVITTTLLPGAICYVPAILQVIDSYLKDLRKNKSIIILN